MSHYFKDVQKFQDKFGLISPTVFTILTPDLLEFRVNFLREEWQEYVDSCAINDLATAIDSLVDLVYIICGTAIFHGISAKAWDEIILDEDDLFNVDELVFVTSDEPLHLKPTQLSPHVNVEFISHLDLLIEDYHTAALDPRQHNVRQLLGALYQSVLAGASYMGITPRCWDEFWNDVQGANMKKERVLRSEDSKRGSTYDVRKPNGWVPPDSEGILLKWTV